jgi:hypothetical protein
MAMSPEHKEALARGRTEARAIKSYLDALGNRRPGRPVTEKSLTDRIAKLAAQISAESDPLRAVELRQKRHDAEDALAGLGSQEDFTALEAGFVEAVRGYGDRKGIGYSAWREAGVPADVLKLAGVPRTRRG